MTGKVFLKKDLPIELKRGNGRNIEFSVEYTPNAADISPVSKRKGSPDVVLASKLKHLLGSNRNSGWGVIGITGKMKFYKYSDKISQRPSANESSLKEDRLNISLFGDFLWFLNTLKNTDTSVQFEIQFKNIFNGGENKSVVCRFEELEGSMSSEQVNFFNEYDMLSYTKANVGFYLNTATWDNLFGNKGKNHKRIAPKITLIVSANISDRMEQARIIVGPYGNCYNYTHLQLDICRERRIEVDNGKKTDGQIVGQSGKTWDVITEYLVEGSPVFQAMFQSEGFVEGRTKTAQLPDLDDEVVSCLIKYLYYFDMEDCLRDTGFAVQMLEIAERFQVKELSNCLEEMLGRMEDKNIAAENAIQLFAFVRHLDQFKLLKRKALMALKSDKESWENSEDCKRMIMKHPGVAWDLATALMDDGLCNCKKSSDLDEQSSDSDEESMN